MANFQKYGRNVHGQVVVAMVEQVFEIGLSGPIDTRSMTEIVVTSANPMVLISKGGMVPGQNVRIWQFEGLPVGRTFVEAKDSAGIVWSSVTIDGRATPVSSWIVTKEQLKLPDGSYGAKSPPSPVIEALISLLRRGTNNELYTGTGSLESAGRAGNLYEHTSGLALDIYRQKGNPKERAQAHNLIRFFIVNRRLLGWRNMFYESWGFTQSQLTGGEANHDSHIHIDWMDFSLLKYDGPNKLDRSKWTEITYPVNARIGSAVSNVANEAQVRLAWTVTLAPILTDAEISTLYQLP